MKTGKWYITTGFIKSGRWYWHLLGAVHRRWRLSLVRPGWRPGYKRIYLGPFEIEFSIHRFIGEKH